MLGCQVMLMGNAFSMGAWGMALVWTTCVMSEHSSDLVCTCGCGKRVDAAGVDKSEACVIGARVLRG